MILKELDAFPGTNNPLLKAGRAAEEQMAFYLRREFERSQGVFVINGLRLEAGNDAAQIDHLVIHRGGFILIESKSVHGRVKINEYGEWVRVSGTRQTGMPSPIQQAKRQAEFLQVLLNDNAPEVGDKVLGLQFRFGAVAFDVLVAISDTGIIERPKGKTPSEMFDENLVCKAEVAGERITRRMEAQKRSSLNFLASDSNRLLSASEVDKICRFVLARHKPLLAAPPQTGPVPTDPDATELPDAPSAPVEGTALAGVCCEICGKEVTEAVRKYCEDNATRFGGKIYCYTHQRKRNQT